MRDDDTIKLCHALVSYDEDDPDEWNHCCAMGAAFLASGLMTKKEISEQYLDSNLFRELCNKFYGLPFIPQFKTAVMVPAEDYNFHIGNGIEIGGKVEVRNVEELNDFTLYDMKKMADIIEEQFENDNV